MPSTHTSLHVHAIYAPKRREPVLHPSWRPGLYAYLGGIARDLQSVALEIGGMQDHVHVVLGLRATHAVSEVLREIKQGTSRWIHEVVGLRSFAWQEGYGAFSVCRSDLEEVRAYVRDQEEHHRVKTFREEYLEFLARNDVKFDPRYVF